METDFSFSSQHGEMQEMISKALQNVVNEPLVYTIEQAAEKLQISKSKAYELARQNEIPTVKIGGRVMVPRRRLDEWLNQQSEG